jgi:hypothetical protein
MRLATSWFRAAIKIYSMSALDPIELIVREAQLARQRASEVRQAARVLTQELASAREMRAHLQQELEQFKTDSGASAKNRSGQNQQQWFARWARNSPRASAIRVRNSPQSSFSARNA